MLLICMHRRYSAGMPSITLRTVPEAPRDALPNQAERSAFLGQAVAEFRSKQRIGIDGEADTFVDIELWAEERLDSLRRHLRLANGIPSPDTFGRLFCLIDPGEFAAAFRSLVSAIAPSLGADAVVGGKPLALVHGCRFRRRPDACPYRSRCP